MKVMEDVPYVVGLDKWLGTELDDAACTYLRTSARPPPLTARSACTTSQTSRRRIKELGEALIAPGARLYVIDDQELQRIQDGYPSSGKTGTRSRSSASWAARICRSSS